MTNPHMVDVKNMTESDRFLLLYQGWRDTWKEVQDHKEDVSRELLLIKGDVSVHNKLLITGDEDRPSHSEMLRNHQKFIDTIGKLAWLVVGAIIVQVLSFIGIAIWTVAQLYPLLNKIANIP